MAVQKEIWQEHVVGGLWKNNQFLNYAVNEDQYVLAGKVVHIPQAGAASSVTKNRAVYPAVAVKRADTDVTYALDEFTTDPRHIPDAEKSELSYDKRESVIGEDSSHLRQAVADNMLITWAPTVGENLLRTSGDATNSHITGTTGTRKLMTLDDFEACAGVLDDHGVPDEERYAMFSSRMYRQLTSLLKGTEYRDFMAAIDPKTGVVGELFGFKILKRKTVLQYSNAATPVVNPYGAATAATDNDGILCWQRNAVARAMGEVKMFENTDDATYYGDVYSFLLRMGGRKRRADDKGVVALIQDAAA